MIARTATWQEVVENAYVRDRNGKTWRVLILRENEVSLVDKAGKIVELERPRAYHPVVLVELTTGDAIKTVQDILEAVVIEEVVKA